MQKLLFLSPISVLSLIPIEHSLVSDEVLISTKISL